MFWRTRRPLLGCEVVHDLPGRVRVRCRALRYLAEHAAEIHQQLEELAPVTAARVSTITTNVLVRYDRQQSTGEEIRQLVESAIGSFSLIAYKAERAAGPGWRSPPAYPTHRRRPDPGRPRRAW